MGKGNYILKANSRWGHFNFANLSEKQLCVTFTLGNKRISVMQGHGIGEQNIWELNGYIGADEAHDLLQTWLDNIWISTQRNKVENFKKLLIKNKDKIEKANKKALSEDLLRQRKELDERIRKLKEVE
jgi:copper homeostasis protein CutC